MELSEIVSLTSHSNGDTVFSDTVLTFDVDPTDLNWIKYQIDAEPLVSFDTPYEIVVPGPDGIHTVAIQVQHSIRGIVQISFTFTVDDTLKPTPTRTDFSTVGIIITAVISLSYLVTRKKNKS